MHLGLRELKVYVRAVSPCCRWLLGLVSFTRTFEGATLFLNYVSVLRVFSGKTVDLPVEVVLRQEV